MSGFAPDEVARCDRWDAVLLPTTRAHRTGTWASSPQRARCREIGRAVAQPGIEAASAAGLPAFLETGVERNLELYERLGFVVTGVIDDPDLPRGWCMRRD